MEQKELMLWLCVSVQLTTLLGTAASTIKEAACGSHFHIAQVVTLSELSSSHMIEYPSGLS